jgi:hypothetical protein
VGMASDALAKRDAIKAVECIFVQRIVNIKRFVLGTRLLIQLKSDFELVVGYSMRAYNNPFIHNPVLLNSYEMARIKKIDYPNRNLSSNLMLLLCSDGEDYVCAHTTIHLPEG